MWNIPYSSHILFRPTALAVALILAAIVIPARSAPPARGPIDPNPVLEGWAIVPLTLDPNAPNPGPAVATFDGRPLNSQMFYGLLMQTDGLRVFEELYDLLLVQRALEIAGFRKEGPEFQKTVDAELERTLNNLVVASDNPAKPLDREAKLMLLEQQIKHQGILIAEFSVRLQVRAGLRTLAAGKIDVTDQEVVVAYHAEFGPRRAVHLIPVDGPDQAAGVRDLMVTRKMTPEQAAIDLKLKTPMSMTVADNATGMDEVKTVTFEIQKEGELSNIVRLPRVNGQPAQSVVIVLDKILPDRLAQNPLDAKKQQELQGHLHEEKENLWMEKHLVSLRANPPGQVVITDPIFRAQVDKIQLKAEAQRAAAVMQPVHAIYFAPAFSRESVIPVIPLPAATPP